MKNKKRVGARDSNARPSSFDSQILSTTPQEVLWSNAWSIYDFIIKKIKFSIRSRKIRQFEKIWKNSLNIDFSYHRGVTYNILKRKLNNLGECKNIFRFWSFQILACSMPSIIFVIYSGHKAREKSKLESEAKKRQKERAHRTNPERNPTQVNSFYPQGLILNRGWIIFLGKFITSIAL